MQTPAELYQWLSTRETCYMATLDLDGLPRVRCMSLDYAGPSGLRFHMTEEKDVYQQLCAQADVEICWVDAGYQVRVRGELRRTAEKEYIEHALAKRPFLAQAAALHGEFFAVILKLENATADVTTPEGRYRFEL